MRVQKSAHAGTLQSNDCFIRISPSERLEILFNSPVAYEFGEQVEAMVQQCLERLGIDAVRVEIEDRGALDCTIAARLCTAIGRAK